MTFEKERGIVRKEKIRIKAVDGVSFEVRESEFVSIVGETGSGKSTLARCMVGLAKPTSGTIMFNGVDTTEFSGKKLKEFRRNVQMIFQDPFESLNPRQDVFRIISTPIRNLVGEKNNESLRKRVSELLQEVGLDPDEVAHRLPHQLSGGQRQRVSIARALSSDPDLLIADEPITMLDAAQRLNILSLLSDLKEKRKLTVIMITHDLSSAKITSDRIMIMYLGKLVESGHANVIVSSPYHPYVELIMASQARLTSKVSIAESPQSSDTGEGKAITGCVFKPRCKYATDVCVSEVPELRTLSPAHLAACHHPLNQNNTY